MKKVIFFCFMLLASSWTMAQNTCPVPSQTVAVFFGNGINTSEKSAKRSLERIRDEIGDSCNGQKVRYDVAYNKTSGIFVDLIQSSAQALIQWDSQIMGWFNGIGVAPDWFNRWYQKFLLAFTTVVADELPEHVDKYSTAIAFGQKVVVVSHSQGNFYVNEAKKLMQQKLSADKMNSFAIFGVAVPSNNVGGASGPYYTNHRDFIYAAVPTALPQNWTLRHTDGTLAQDVGPVQAHLFTDTYISTNFDIRPALVSGIKAKMNAVQQPVPDCTTYRPNILAMVAGSYDTSCQNSPGGTLTISTKGVTTAGGQFIDMNGPDSLVSLGRSESGTSLVGGASWNGNGALQSSCGDAKGSLAPIHITSTMMDLIESTYQMFPANRCFVRSGGAPKALSSATSVVVSGTTVYVGDTSWDFGASLKSEIVNATQGNSTNPSDYDPGFTLAGVNQTGISTLLTYRRMKGLRSVSVMDHSQPITNQIMLSCSFP